MTVQELKAVFYEEDELISCSTFVGGESVKLIRQNI